MDQNLSYVTIVKVLEGVQLNKSELNNQNGLYEIIAFN